MFLIRSFFCTSFTHNVVFKIIEHQIKKVFTYLKVDSGEKSAVVLIDVEGMTCNSCVSNIERVIGQRDHVHSVKVSLENKNATIEFDASHETPTGLCDAICEMGFDAFLKNNTLETVLIAIEGMTCQSCVKTITEVMLTKNGVKNINVSLEKNNALIEYDTELANVDFLCQSIEEMGFDACKGSSVRGRVLIIIFYFSLFFLLCFFILSVDFNTVFEGTW